MRTMLVTGGAGFIGTHLVRALLARGDVVRVLDNFCEGTPANLARALGLPVDEVHLRMSARAGVPVELNARCEIVNGDIRDPDAVAVACTGADVVFHQAALRSVPRSIHDPEATTDVNVTGTLRVLEAAKRAGVRRFVFASSSSVYGDTPLPKHEAQIPQPRSPYAASKLAGEALCQAYSRAFGLPTVCLRYFNVFGPWQDPASEYAAVIPKFIRLAMDAAPLPVHGDGMQSRDFTYVDNVVDANLQAADTDADAVALNIGAGERYTLLDLVGHIGRILDRAPQVLHEPARPGDVRHTEADVALAGRLIGYEPRVDFPTGLRRTIEAMLAEHREVVTLG